MRFSLVDGRKPRCALSALKPPRIRSDKSFVPEVPLAVNKYGSMYKHAGRCQRALIPAQLPGRHGGKLDNCGKYRPKQSLPPERLLGTPR